MKENKIPGAPVLKIGGVSLTPPPPTAGAWREFVKTFNESDIENMLMSDFLDAHLRLLQIAYGEQLTDELLQQMEVSEVLPKTREVMSWMQTQVFVKLAQIKNEEAGAALAQS